MGICLFDSVIKKRPLVSKYWYNTSREVTSYWPQTAFHSGWFLKAPCWLFFFFFNPVPICLLLRWLILLFYPLSVLWCKLGFSSKMTVRTGHWGLVKGLQMVKPAPSRAAGLVLWGWKAQWTAGCVTGASGKAGVGTVTQSSHTTADKRTSEWGGKLANLDVFHRRTSWLNFSFPSRLLCSLMKGDIWMAGLRT